MLNSCSFIGRLGRDPEIRQTNSGKSVASFSLACSEKYNGEEKTEWVNVVAWEKLADVIGKYLTKGSLVYIGGKMQTRKWQDKEGTERYTAEIICREMKMLGGGSGKQREGQEEQSKPSESPYPPSFTGNDVPF